MARHGCRGRRAGDDHRAGCVGGPVPAAADADERHLRHEQRESKAQKRVYEHPPAARLASGLPHEDAGEPARQQRDAVRVHARQLGHRRDADVVIYTAGRWKKKAILGDGGF